MEPRMLEIKKYANRRYYDATHSRHLTLEEIRNLIQKGHDLKVTDAKTGADITGQVLTQIILELDTPKLDSLPVPLLLRLIRMNDHLVKDFIDKYFNQALSSFLEYQKQMEAQVRRAHGLPETIPTMAQWTKAMMQPFTAAFGAAPTADAAPPAPEEKDVRELVRELQEQIEQLKQTRTTQTPRRPRAGKRRSAPA